VVDKSLDTIGSIKTFNGSDEKLKGIIWFICVWFIWLKFSITLQAQRGVLGQLPYMTANQDQTSTTLNDHIMAMCGILSTINMLRSMFIANFVHPTSSSPQNLQLARVLN